MKNYEFSKFNIQDVKIVSTPLTSHFKFSKEDFPKTEREKDYRSEVSYVSAMDNLIYAMVSTRPNIAQIMRVVNRFINKPR